MKRISVVIGSRPQAVKLAPVIVACKHHRGIKTSVCVTTRRSEVVQQVLDVFGITPDADLGLKVADRSLPALTARASRRWTSTLGDAKPDFVFVQSDTATTFCATLASFYRGTPVGQVEAGLRAGDAMAAFPEESFRILTSRLATLHFAPTEHAKANLLREQPGHIFHTGAPMTIRLQVQAQAPVDDFVFGVGLFNADGVCCFGTNTDLEELVPERLDGGAEVRFHVESLDLTEGTYKLDVAVHKRDGAPYDYHRLLYTFRVKSRTKDVGIYRPPHRWHFSGNVRLRGPDA